MSDILFLAHRIPFPPDRGDKIRSFHMLRHLAGLGRVHLACFADDEADAAHLEGLRSALGDALGDAHVEIRRTGKLGAAVKALRSGKPMSLCLFDGPGMRPFVRRILARREVGAVFAFSSQMAQFVPHDARQRFLMDFVDMDSAKFGEYARAGGAMGRVYAREAATLLAFERQTAARADVSLFVSEAEAGLFRSKANLPTADIRGMSNGIDLDFFDPRARVEAVPKDGPLIVFTGQMDYQPNADAVAGFAAQAMPFVRRERPDARFAIVGRNPGEAVLRLGKQEGVLVTGAVPDVRTWLAAADVVVAPLRIARGIQNKVLEAMAMARPVVASPAAFEGIEAEPGCDLIVAEGAGAQARAVLDLIEHPDRAAAIAAAARHRMESGYRWEARLAPLAVMLTPPVREAAA